MKSSPITAWKVSKFRRPIYCPNAAHDGYATRYVAVGDLIVVSSSLGTFARVLGCIPKDRNSLVVLQLSSGFTSAYLAEVNVQDVKRILPPTLGKDFLRYFFEGNVTGDLQALERVVNIGGMGLGLPKYLRKGKLHPDQTGRNEAYEKAFNWLEKRNREGRGYASKPEDRRPMV